MRSIGLGGEFLTQQQVGKSAAKLRWAGPWITLAEPDQRQLPDRGVQIGDHLQFAPGRQGTQQVDEHLLSDGRGIW